MFQGYNRVIRHFYTLQSDHPNKSSSHLTPHIVQYYWLYFQCLLYISVTIFSTGNLYFLIPFTFFTQPPTQPIRQPSIGSLYLWVCFCFAYSSFSLKFMLLAAHKWKPLSPADYEYTQEESPWYVLWMWVAIFVAPRYFTPKLIKWSWNGCRQCIHKAEFDLQ